MVGLKGHMIKKWMLVCCLLMLIVPVTGYAQDKAWMKNEHKDEYYSILASNTNRIENLDGSYHVMGDEPTLENFSWDEISTTVKKPFFQNLVNSLLHRQEYQDIQKVIEECQHYFLFDVCSGSIKLQPRSCFTNDGVYQEANARNFYMMFKVPDAGLGCEEEVCSYSLDTVKISDNVAKVFITRSIKTIDENPISDDRDCGVVVEENVREGYLLEKVNDEWKIANILFDNAAYLEGEASRIFNDENQTVNLFRMFEDAEDASIWTERFNFEKCQRKDYCPYGNYMSYIIGDIEALIFDYDKLVYERDHPDATIENWRALQSDQ